MGSARIRRVVVGAAVVVLGAAGAALVFGVGQEQIEVYAATGDPGSTQLSLTIQSCGKRPRVEVQESVTEVGLSAFVARSRAFGGEGACQDPASVTLRSPLGSRTVVDTLTGKRLLPAAPR